MYFASSVNAGLHGQVGLGVLQPHAGGGGGGRVCRSVQSLGCRGEQGRTGCKIRPLGGRDQTVGVLHGGSERPWALQNARGQEQRSAMGLKVAVDSEARVVQGDLGLLGGAPILLPAGFPSEQEPVPFFLGSAEASYGSGNVLIGPEVIQGT